MKRPELQIDFGESGVRRITVDRPLRLGRSSNSDLHIADEALSRSHCLFEPSGDYAIKVTDLASANGTFVNGENIGQEPRMLDVGDRVEVGETIVHIVSAEPINNSAVDLGLEPKESQAEAKARRHSPLIHVVLGIALTAAIAVGYFLITDHAERQPVAPIVPYVPEEIIEPLMSVRYEKVVADTERILRYEFNVATNGELKVSLDDISDEERRFSRPCQLSEESSKHLAEMLSAPGVTSLADEYGDIGHDPQRLTEITLDVVWSNHVQRVHAVNAELPSALAALIKDLETFANNELGAWAMGYSRAELERKAAESAERGRIRWQDRDVEYGNVHAAVAAYREAKFYLDTVNPKPEVYAEYCANYDAALAELERRYSEQRFTADRLVNLKNWSEASDALRILCSMIPDRTDPRFIEAEDKLVYVEKQLKMEKHK